MRKNIEEARIRIKWLEVRRKKDVQLRSYVLGTLQQVACVVPYHQWIYEQFAWYGPLLINSLKEFVFLLLVCFDAKNQIDSNWMAT